MIFESIRNKINTYFKNRKRDKTLHLLCERDKHIVNIDKLITKNETQEFWSYVVAKSKNGHFTIDEHDVNSMLKTYYTYKGYYVCSKINNDSDYACLTVVIKNHNVVLLRQTSKKLNF